MWRIWLRRRGCIRSCWGNRREGDHWGDLGVDGWIIQSGAKKRLFFNLPAISFFGVTSNQNFYVRKPLTVDDLKASIHEEIATVPQVMLVNVMQNFEERLRTCARQEGYNIP